ncbi:MAG: ABC transporter substrate-binding protein [Candidatus Methylarchaceae archaeon HK02M2]|nr:ABC transporter substrate-binding protein [Candidatus Methylarchaceae archaeon HK02M2]
MKQIIIVIGILLVIITGVVVVALWQQSYAPPEPTGPFWVIDDVGRNVTIHTYPPESIVSLSPSSTEILFALGLGDKVVGVDTYSDYPEETENISKVGSFSTISIEAVLGLKPDLVLATGGIQKTVVEDLEEPLNSINGSIVVLSPQNISAILSDITMVGNITGKMNEANILVADMENKIQEIVDKTQGAVRPRVYIEYFFNGGYWSFGSESMINEVIYKAGGINIFAGFQGTYMATNDEAIFTSVPEVIIICKGAMAKSCGLTPEVIEGRSGWDQLPAVENNRIYEVDDPILTRPGPRIVEAIETLASFFHPELVD